MLKLECLDRFMVQHKPTYSGTGSVSFNCGYGQEMGSYTPAEFFQAMNSQWNDSKYDYCYLAGDDSPFGKWTTNAKWFNNYYECREYTNSLQD